jgi:hypothetical protein
MINSGPELPVSDQCRLLGLARSAYLLRARVDESVENLDLIRLIDQLYLAHPENFTTPTNPSRLIVLTS